jgi:hypothetical protein
VRGGERGFVEQSIELKSCVRFHLLDKSIVAIVRLEKEMAPTYSCCISALPAQTTLLYPRAHKVVLIVAAFCNPLFASADKGASSWSPSLQVRAGVRAAQRVRLRGGRVRGGGGAGAGAVRGADHGAAGPQRGRQEHHHCHAHGTAVAHSRGRQSAREEHPHAYGEGRSSV